MMKPSNFKDTTHYAIDNSISLRWSKKRNKITDLYKSEKFFFLKLINKSESYLDVGCAAGGFYKIIKSIKNNPTYYGFDISSDLIKLAKKSYKLGKFYLYDGKTINFKKKVDLTFSFGTLHHVNNYLSLIKQMIKYSNKYVLFDVRLTKNKTIINKRKSFQFISNRGKIVSKINYNIINKKEFFLSLSKIAKKFNIKFYFYNHKVSNTVISSYKKVLMTSVFIDKTFQK